MGKRARAASAHKCGKAKDRPRTKSAHFTLQTISHHYVKLQPGKSVLVVGDGDFSFSESLMDMVGRDVRITATGLDTEAEVLVKYPSAAGHIRAVRSKGGRVEHGVDATALHAIFPKERFDLVIFNFPHSGQQRVHVNRVLLRDFFSSAARLFVSEGQVNLTLKCKPPYSEWQMDEAATSAGFRRQAALYFDVKAFTHYAHVTTDPNAKQIDYRAVKTFVFACQAVSESWRIEPLSEDGQTTITTKNPGQKSSSLQSTAEVKFGIWGRIETEEDQLTQHNQRGLFSPPALSPDVPFPRLQQIDLSKVEMIVPDIWEHKDATVPKSTSPSTLHLQERQAAVATIAKLSRTRGYLTPFEVGRRLRKVSM
eukprot:gb/GEZN01006870.1/.p1 GENE.gb/GEZN01006870.1/~~gb/GEZN01006870.1/.p1  ORF type:complete len:367 (-),score=26.77 gb/GEZN01006870.1/:382-1482(-)